MEHAVQRQCGALGLEGSGRDPYNREAFPWHREGVAGAWDMETLEHLRRCNKTRAELAVLRRGGFRFLGAAPERGDAAAAKETVAWARDLPDLKCTAVCVFNSGRGEAGAVRRCRLTSA